MKAHISIKHRDLQGQGCKVTWCVLCRGDHPLAQCKFAGKRFLDTPVSKICIWPHPKRRILAPSARGHLWPQSKPIRWWKVSEIFRSFRENSGKRFFFGAISLLTGGKLSERRVLSYMGARVLSALVNNNVNFQKKSLPICHVFVHFWWHH